MESQTDLRRVGLKVTGPRMKILAIFEQAQGETQHLSADDVYKRLLDADEDIGLATVYRVLTQFEAAEILTRHNFEGGHAVYELNHGHHHDHLVCVKCGKVKEFVDDIIEQRQHEIAAQANFKMTDHSLNIYGFCADCNL